MSNHHIDLQGKIVDLQPISHTERAAAAVDRLMHKFVAQANKPDRFVDQIIHDPLPIIETKPMISNRTGLRDAMAAIKEKAAAARDKSLAASEKVKEAFEHQARVTESVERYADDVMKESNEVLAELGQFSNGGPE